MAREGGFTAELIKSLNRFSWAMSLFGIQQMAKTLWPVRAGPVARGESGTPASSRVLAASPGRGFTEEVRPALRDGPGRQNGMGSLMHTAVALVASTPRQATKVAFDLMRQSAEAARLLLPGEDARAGWQELRNKLEAFTLFEYVDGLLPAAHRTLPEMVDRAASLEPFRSVWALEGVGHYYCEGLWASAEGPRGMLSDEHTLPERSLVPLHSGMGLSLANRALAKVGPDVRDAEVERSLRWLAGSCEANCRDGYFGAAYEGLGLVARNLYPQTIAAIDRALAADEVSRGHFWHGVGRALYFAPTNLVPCIGPGQRAVQRAKTEPPHDLAARNAVAGLAWAMTLVNLRHPWILEAFLRSVVRHPVDEVAFADGVRRALTIWQAAAPADPDLDALCRYRSHASDPQHAALWRRLVQEPCARALQPAAQSSTAGSLGDLFRYQGGDPVRQ